MICWIVEAIAWAVAGCVTTLALAHACNGPALVDPRVPATACLPACYSLPSTGPCNGPALVDPRVPATACLALAHVMDLRWLIHMCLLQPA